MAVVELKCAKDDEQKQCTTDSDDTLSVEDEKSSLGQEKENNNREEEGNKKSDSSSQQEEEEKEDIKDASSQEEEQSERNIFSRFGSFVATPFVLVYSLVKRAVYGAQITPLPDQRALRCRRSAPSTFPLFATQKAKRQEFPHRWPVDSKYRQAHRRTMSAPPFPGLKMNARSDRRRNRN